MRNVQVPDDAVVIVLTQPEWLKLCKWLHVVHGLGDALDKAAYIPGWLGRKLHSLNLPEGATVFKGSEKAGW